MIYDRKTLRRRLVKNRARLYTNRIVGILDCIFAKLCDLDDDLDNAVVEQ